MNSLNRKSGGSSSILDLANMFVSIGEDVTIYTVLGTLDKLIYRPKNISHKITIRPMWTACLSGYQRKYRKKVNSLLNHFYAYDYPENAIVIDAFRLDPDIICKLKENGNKIILNHAGSPNAFMKYFGMNGKKREDEKKARHEYIKLIDRYDYIWFQSPSQAQELQKIVSLGDMNKMIVLTPGVDESLLKESRSPDVFKNRFNIVIIGSVHYRKGQHLIPEIYTQVAEKISNIYFHVVGPIVDKEYYANINKNDNIQFYGFQKNYFNFIKGADIVLQLSEEEGVSRILREAMFLQKPIVSFDLEGTRDLLVDHEDAILVPYGNTDGIAKAIFSLYEDKSLAQNMAQRAYANYMKKYASDIYREKLKEVLKQIK